MFISVNCRILIGVYSWYQSMGGVVTKALYSFQVLLKVKGHLVQKWILDLLSSLISCFVRTFWKKVGGEGGIFDFLAKGGGAFGLFGKLGGGASAPTYKWCDATAPSLFQMSVKPLLHDMTILCSCVCICMICSPSYLLTSKWDA